MKENGNKTRLFNLITERWLPVRRRSGRRDMIAPKDLAQTTEDPPVAFAWPRRDLNGAAHEWCIGLLSTVCAPLDDVDWERWWDTPPSGQVLGERLDTVAHAFNMIGDGPRFAQDLDPLEHGKQKPVRALLIDTPGEQTVEFNADIFAAEMQVEALGPGAAAIVLHALQCYAPMGGGGNLVSLRGGGPLTTLVIAKHPVYGETLWGRVWPNVESKRQIEARSVAHGHGEGTPFPWMHPTRRWHGKGGAPTLPEQIHPLEVYWSMPRSVRLEFTDEGDQRCTLTGTNGFCVARTARTMTHATKYPKEKYRHPLTPYKDDKKLGKKPVLARTGCNTYKLWPIGIAPAEGGGYTAAQTLRAWREGRQPPGTTSRAASYGYEMSGMLVMDWIEGEIPLVSEPPAMRVWLEELAQRTASGGATISNWLGRASREGEAKARKAKGGDRNALGERFFNETEEMFHRQIAACKRAISDGGAPKEILRSCATAWRISATHRALALFDETAGIGSTLHEGAARKARARERLRRALSGWGSDGRKLFESDLDVSAPATRAKAEPPP